jgi:predicted nucleotidyltransferase
MNFDLHKRTIFLTVSGSRAFGFSSPTSDWDYRGIVIPPLDSYIGILGKFEHMVDSDKNNPVSKYYPDGLLQPDADMQLLELTKFVSLAAQNNPSIIEILFTDPRFFVIKTPIMDRLLDVKYLFLSKTIKARFCGYALSQLKRIKRHKRWLDNPPTHQPTREEYGLPNRSLISQDQMGAAEALIQKELDEFMIEQTHLPEDVKVELSSNLGRMMRAVWVSINKDRPYPVGDGFNFESTEDALFWGAASDQGFSDNFLEVLNREKRYRAALREWNSYQNWLVNRNPARAEIERKFGFDLKHATHLVRLIRMAREILETGEVHVHRPDAEELRAIRNGAWSYEKIVEFAETEDQVLNDVVKTSSLPKVPDRHKIHEITRDMILEFNRA